jgi:hypothetical protein
LRLGLRFSRSAASRCRRPRRFHREISGSSLRLGAGIRAGIPRGVCGETRTTGRVLRAVDVAAAPRAGVRLQARVSSRRSGGSGNAWRRLTTPRVGGLAFYPAGLALGMNPTSPNSRTPRGRGRCIRNGERPSGEGLIRKAEVAACNQTNRRPDGSR